MTAKPVTAAFVRTSLRADSKRTKGLSEAALATIAEGARGRLHPEAVAAFNKGRKAHRRYATGATKAVTAQAKAEAVALRKAAAAAGVKVGERGPLPKAALAALKG